jgi:hypothetical protein
VKKTPGASLRPALCPVCGVVVKRGSELPQHIAEGCAASNGRKRQAGAACEPRRVRCGEGACACDSMTLRKSDGHQWEWEALFRGV